jgi:hypothetical protein
MAHGISERDVEAARALVAVLGDSRWDAVALARGYLAAVEGADDITAARVAYEQGLATLRGSRELIARARNEGFVAVLPPRKKLGSAENPVTKLFPGTITEQRFLELADRLCDTRQGLSYSDDRQAEYTLSDLTFREKDVELPVNIKVASTRFERSAQLVGLDPADSVPIPAYKANGALERVPSLLYAIAVDHTLIQRLDSFLPQLFSPDEVTVWRLLNQHGGARIKNGEDIFVFRMVKRHWETIRKQVADTPFHVVSARKAIRILQTKPERTPGIGLRAWGTGASAEVNVHLSISEDMKSWEEIGERIRLKGLQDIITAVNRKRVEEVYDPEI